MSANGTSRGQPVYLTVALLCFAALANACGSNGSTAHSYAALPGCEKLDIAPCDTQKSSCQASRLELAACLRQTDAGKLPAVTVMTEAAYVDYANALNENNRFTGTNHFELAMTWLGLAQLGSFGFVPLTKASIANWFGTYRWREKDLLIIDHGKPADDEASNVALVAALIRRLRDYDIDIGSWSTVVSIFDVDSNWGGDAMYFGEARLYSNRYQAALEGLDSSSSAEIAKINDGIRDDVAWITTQPSSYVATNDRFAHNFGARAAYLAWQRNGADAVNALFDSKLLTQQLMASETEQAPMPTLKYHGRPVAPHSWGQDPIVTAIGAWGLFLSLSRTLPTDAAWSLALGWSGEQIFVYKGAESEDTAMVWQLEMTDEASASALQVELQSANPSAQLQRSGTFVTLAMATNQDPLDWAFVAD